MNRYLSIRYALLLGVLFGLLMELTPAVAGTLQAVPPHQFKALLDQHHGDSDFVLLDVRTPREFADGHIRGALLINYYAPDFVDRIRALDKDKTYLVYCRSGNRSGKTLAIFKQLGFRHVYDMASGIIGWSRQHYPLVGRPTS